MSNIQMLLWSNLSEKTQAKKKKVNNMPYLPKRGEMYNCFLQFKTKGQRRNHRVKFKKIVSSM